MHITCIGLQEVVPRHDKACYYFWGREEYLGFYVGGVPNVTRILMMGQSSDSIWKKNNEKKKVWVHPSLNNRSPNKYLPFINR